MAKNKKKEEKKKSKEVSFVVSKIIEYSNKDEFEQLKDKLAEELEDLEYEVSDHIDEENIDEDDIDEDDTDEDEYDSTDDDNPF